MLGSYRQGPQGDLFGTAAAMAATLHLRGAPAGRDIGVREAALRSKWADIVRQYGHGRVQVLFWARTAPPECREFVECDEFAQFTAQVESAGFHVAFRCA